MAGTRSYFTEMSINSEGLLFFVKLDQELLEEDTTQRDVSV